MNFTYSLLFNEIPVLERVGKSEKLVSSARRIERKSFFFSLLIRFFIPVSNFLFPLKRGIQFRKMFVYHIAPVNMNFPYSDMSKMEIFDLAMAHYFWVGHLSGVVP